MRNLDGCKIHFVETSKPSVKLINSVHVSVGNWTRVSNWGGVCGGNQRRCVEIYSGLMGVGGRGEVSVEKRR